MAFKIATQQRCGEGIDRYLPPTGYECVSFNTAEQAARHLYNYYGQGVVTDLEGQLVMHV